MTDLQTSAPVLAVSEREMTKNDWRALHAVMQMARRIALHGASVPTGETTP